MTDIVERLRAGFQCAEIGNRCRTMDTQSGCVCAEAADEIERLRGGMLKMASAMSRQIETIEKLRAALEEIAGLGAICASDIAAITLRRSRARAALDGK